MNTFMAVVAVDTANALKAISATRAVFTSIAALGFLRLLAFGRFGFKNLVDIFDSEFHFDNSNLAYLSLPVNNNL